MRGSNGCSNGVRRALAAGLRSAAAAAADGAAAAAAAAAGGGDSGFKC